MEKNQGYATMYSFIEEWNYSYKKTMLAKKISNVKHAFVKPKKDYSPILS
jgi:hypothetical protein